MEGKIEDGYYVQKEKIMYVTEVYYDKEETLQQSIMYKYGDDRERDYRRSTLNPHVTELVSTRYYDEDMKVIATILAKKEEE